jgi:hypothetical protein
MTHKIEILEAIQAVQRYCDQNRSSVFFSPASKIKAGPEYALENWNYASFSREMAQYLPAAKAGDGFAVTLDAPGYFSLAEVLRRAFDQASAGKGKERHANALPFEKQPMQTIADQVGIGFLLGQAIKKVQESQSLPAGRNINELLGAINYLAGAVIYLEAQLAKRTAPPQPGSLTPSDVARHLSERANENRPQPYCRCLSSSECGSKPGVDCANLFPVAKHA